MTSCNTDTIETDTPNVNKNKEDKKKTKEITKNKNWRINIIQNNIGHNRLATEELQLNLNLGNQNNNQANIICLQEPYLVKDKPALLPKEYSKMFSNKENKPRAIILVNKEFDNEIMYHENYSNRDTATISIKNPEHKTKRLYISSVYMHNDDLIENHLINQLIKKARSNKDGLIICADTNARHTLWGNELDNKRGEDLARIFLGEHELAIENTDLGYTRSNIRSTSTIDLTLTNAWTPDIKSWNIIRDVSSSDHELIQMHFENQIKEVKQNIERDHKNCNLKQFRQKVTDTRNGNIKYTKKLERAAVNNHKTLPHTDDINYVNDKLTNLLKTAYEESCPIKKLKRKINNGLWDKSLRSKHRRLIMIRRKISKQRHNQNTKELIENHKKYKKGKKTFAKLINKTFQKKRRDYFNKINNVKEAARLAKITETKNTKIGSLKKDDGNFTNSPKETLEELCDKLIGKQRVNNESIDDKHEITTSQVAPCELDKIISLKRLRKAVKELKINKAPGKDGIRNEMIKESIKDIENDLVILFRSCIAKCCIPNAWKIGEGKILAKSGKSDYSIAKAYRIITLSSCLMKLLETLILWHLQTDLKIEKASSKHQHGFKAGSSTDTAVVNLIEKIENAINNGNHALGIFLDIEGAFDNLPYDTIEEALNKTEAKGQIANWIICMIKSRSICLKMAGAEIIRTIAKGAPQGGVLSPFLWNLVLDGLLTMFAKTQDLQAFADDLCLLIIGKDYNMTKQETKKRMEIIENWCDSVGLKISTLKTQVMIWSTQRNFSRPTNITHKNESIPILDSVKYLGITLDSKLNWNEHVDNITKKCLKQLFKARMAIGKNWGTGPKTTKWIYTAVVRPSISYGAVAWGYNLSKRNLAKLNKIQHLASIMITRGQQASSQIVLDTMLDLEPIHLFLEKTALLRAATLKETGHWRHYNPINKNDKKLTNMEKISVKLEHILQDDYKKKTDKIIQENILELNFRTCIKNRDEINEPITQDIVCYTDGSKDSNGNTGYGYVIMGKSEIESNPVILIQQSRKLENACTVFQSEVEAINETATILSMNKIKNKNIDIYSDSQAAIKSLDKRKIKNSTVLNCILNLNSLAETNNITINWIPGHRGFVGNEIADKLAKNGALLPKNCTYKTAIPHSFITNKIKVFYTKEQLTAWVIADISPKTKQMINPILKKCNNNIQKLGKAICSLDINQIKLITQILTGKNRLNYHMFNIGYTYSKECDYCQADNEGKRKFWEAEEETSHHILCECPTFSTLRQSIFGEAIMNNLDLPNLKGIQITLKKIVKFFEATKVMERPNKFEKWQLSPPRKKFRK